MLRTRENSIWSNKKFAYEKFSDIQSPNQATILAWVGTSKKLLLKQKFLTQVRMSEQLIPQVEWRKKKLCKPSELESTGFYHCIKLRKGEYIAGVIVKYAQVWVKK